MSPVVGFAMFLAVHLMVTSPLHAQAIPDAPPSHFEGPYGAVRGGVQNVFGGAFINNIDVLTQATRRVVEFTAGYRFQVLGDHLMMGVEANYGFADGDLQHFDPPSLSSVSYSGKNQTAWGLTIGYVDGPENRVAVFAYGFTADRSFDIEIAHSTGLYHQMDGQSFLQYGLGIEASVFGAWHFGVAAGSQVTDYGDLVTNIELKRTLDLRVSVVLQW